MTLSHGVVLCCLLVNAGQASDRPTKSHDAKDKELKAARMEYMKRAARSYEITLASDAAKKLVLVEEPVLRFDDHVTGVVDAIQVVWVLEDRPLATASIWIRKTGQEFHEFQSLAVDPLNASSHGQARWTPAQAGVEWKPAHTMQAPAANAVGRLNQMRGLARAYRGRVIDLSKEEQELRLLPQPMYRYGRPDGDVVDGAIFAYCKGTNPEILLVVEAVRNGKELEWRYAFARMSSRGCEVRRDDKVVWTAPLVRGEPPTDPYYNVVQPYKGPGAKAGSTSDERR